MKKIVLTFGLISGLIVSTLMVLTVPFADEIGFDRAEVIGYTSIVAASLLIFFGIRSYRDNVGSGRVSFGRAFRVGALIALISSVCYTATWEVVYYNFMPDFLEKYQAHHLEKAVARGATRAEIGAIMTKNERDAELYRNPIINVGVTMLESLPIGLVVALISAGVLRRKPENETGETA